MEYISEQKNYLIIIDLEVGSCKNYFSYLVDIHIFYLTI